jgi:hypothetical protein
MSKTSMNQNWTNKASHTFTYILPNTLHAWPRSHHGSMLKIKKNSNLYPTAQEVGRLPPARIKSNLAAPPVAEDWWWQTDCSKKTPRSRCQQQKESSTPALVGSWINSTVTTDQIGTLCCKGRNWAQNRIRPAQHRWVRNDRTMSCWTRDWSSRYATGAWTQIHKEMKIGGKQTLGTNRNWQPTTRGVAHLPTRLMKWEKKSRLKLPREQARPL